jgi:hypothetical protein
MGCTQQELRVRLNPKHPPGRVNRRARAFEAEIARLRADGYTCEAIRVALAEIGLVVSLSTVQREARRTKQSTPSASASPISATSAAKLAPSVAPVFLSSPFGADPRSSKEIAADFVSKHVTNPLLRARSSP